MTVVAVALLLVLGTWQMQRLAWKEHLIAQIEARVGAQPISLDTALARAKTGEDLEYTRVRAQGRFLRDKALYLYAPEPGLPGYHLHMPLELADGRWVFVNRGFVPESWRTKPELALALPEMGDVVGLVRQAGHAGSFTPVNDVAHNLWYWRDLDGMVAATLAGRRAEVLPFYLDEQPGSPPSQGYPRAGVTRLELPNRHLEYALTWYGLAVTLIGVYLAFAWPILRGTKPEKQAENAG